ncbi:hypothetical protein OROGR_011071 [Orobanche gracilis]
MALGLKALPVSFVAHILGIVGAILVLIWCISFRGGLAWEDTNKNLIFNFDQMILRVGGGFRNLSCSTHDLMLDLVSGFYALPIVEPHTSQLDSALEEGIKYWKELAEQPPNNTVLSAARPETLAMSLVANEEFQHILRVQNTNVDGKQKIMLHPVLMLIGLIIIGGEAIMSYKCLPLKKPEKKLIHLVLHAIALVLGIIGVYTAFKFHNESNIANLYSLHSWLGIGVIVLYGIQWVYGFLVFFYPGGTLSIRSESLPWHALLGIFIYVLAVGTAALGYLEKLTFLEKNGLAKYGPEAFLVNFTAIITILYGTFVILTILSQAHKDDEYRYAAI